VRHPDVPESLEGWWILHRMFGFDRRRWALIPDDEQARVAREARDAFAELKAGDGDVALAQLVGHKGDLMLTHYAKSFDGLAQAQTAVDRLELLDYLQPRDSYVSVLELGLYDATAKIHAAVQEKNLKPHSPEWNKAFSDLLFEEEKNPRNFGRLWAKVPARRYVCFYPIDKKRAEGENWYTLLYADRARMMVDHGKIGRTYHGLVTQVISGSVGFDDYEWGVDLYADDPVVFKKLIYEMRFDEVSAKYAVFGPFWSGLQFSVEELPRFLNGEVPALKGKVSP